MGQEIARHHPIRDYGYLDDWLLVECTHLVESGWRLPFDVVRAHLKVESKSAACKYLQDTYILGGRERLGIPTCQFI